MNPSNSAFCDQGKTSCSCKQAPSRTVQTLFENRVAKLLTEPTGEPRIPQGIDHCKHTESGTENVDLNQKIRFGIDKLGQKSQEKNNAFRVERGGDPCMLQHSRGALGHGCIITPIR